MHSGAVLLLLLLSVLAATVNGFSRGPPAFACLNGQPMHGFMRGNTMVLYPPYTQSVLYRISVNNTNWTPGEVLEVKLMSAGSNKFEGFLLRAVRASSMYTNMSLGPLLGSFSCMNSANATMYYRSLYSPMNESNCVTHAQHVGLTEVTCYWTAPSSNEGPVMFIGTAVEEKNKYQYVMSNVLNSTAGMPSSSDGMGVLTQAPTQFGCGTTKMCLLYPPLCDTRGGCTHGVMMTRMADGNVQVEMFGSSIDWLGMGIGPSKDMETMELYVCTYDKVKMMVTLDTAYSPNKAVMAVHRPMVHMRKGMIMYNQSSAALPAQPTMLACSFMRPETEVYTMYAFSRSSLQIPMQMTSKLGDGNYVVLAQGSSIGGGSKMTAQHTHRPLKSPDMVRPSMPMKMYFEGVSKKVKTHATLMTIFWLFLVGFAIVIARHSRPVFNQQVVKKDLWFVLHISFFIIGYAIAIAGVIYLLVMQGGWETGSQTHGIIGLVGMGLALLNILAGLFRPHPESDKRWIFNRLHRYNGLLALLFATISIWLGATFEEHRPEFRLWAIIALAVWTGMQLIFMIGFECVRQSTARNEEFKQTIEKKYQMTNAAFGDQQQQQQEPEEEKVEKVKGKRVKHLSAGFLFLYGAVFFAIAAAFWAGLWMN